jgi:hypothetical protein
LITTIVILRNNITYVVDLVNAARLPLSMFSEGQYDTHLEPAGRDFGNTVALGMRLSAQAGQHYDKKLRLRKIAQFGILRSSQSDYRGVDQLSFEIAIHPKYEHGKEFSSTPLSSIAPRLEHEPEAVLLPIKVDFLQCIGRFKMSSYKLKSRAKFWHLRLMRLNEQCSNWLRSGPL